MEAASFEFERVMIIDDIQLDLEITAHLLTINHFSRLVQGFSNADDAIRYLKTNRYSTARLPQIIFLDIYMPGKSGFDFLEDYLQLPQPVQEYCQVFVLSGTTDPGDIRQLTSHPVVRGFHQKPLNDAFLQKIAKGQHLQELLQKAGSGVLEDSKTSWIY